MGRGGRGTGPDRNGGVNLPRHAPSLWNAGFQQALFWDGRAATLEEQADLVLRDPREMNQTPEGILSKLRKIPKYVRLFEEAFPDDEVPLVYENVPKALASFQRSLHAMGHRLRPLPLGRRRRADRPRKTRHGTVLFNGMELRDVPSRAALPNQRIRRHRRAGTRQTRRRPPCNHQRRPRKAHSKSRRCATSALSPPYMHNGELETLEDVIRFYHNAGGFDHPDLDPRIKWIDMSETDLEDVIAFLHALTDETNTPEIPETVPSGLPVPNPNP